MKESLEEKLPQAHYHEAVETARDVLDLCGVKAGSNKAAADLRNVMDTPHFKVSPCFSYSYCWFVFVGLILSYLLVQNFT